MSRVTVAGLVLVLLSLVPSAWIVHQQSGKPYIGVFHDDSIYFVTAKSIHDGNGYRIASLPANPLECKYPPLYPAFLSLIWKANPSFPANVQSGLFLQWLWFPVFLAAFWYYLKQLPLTDGMRWGLTALTGVSSFTTLMSVTLSSEPLWCALFLTAMALVERSRKDDRANLALLAGGIAAVAYLTRVATLPLLVAAPAYFLMHRQKRSAVLFFSAMFPAVAGWMLWSRLNLPANADSNLLSYISYGGDIGGVPLAELPAQLWADVGHFAAAICGLMMPSPANVPIIGKQIVYLTAAGCFIGAIRFGRTHHWTAYHLFALLYIPIVFAWNWYPSERFVFPLYPILLIGLATEFGHIGNMLAQPKPKKPETAKPWLKPAFLATAAAAVALAQVSTDIQTIPDILSVQQKALVDSQDVFAWLKREVPRNTPLLAWQDAVTYLYTDLPAMRPPAQDAFLKDSMSMGENNAEQAVRVWANRAAATGSLLVMTTGDFVGDSSEAMLASTKQLVMEKTSFRPIYESPRAVVMKLADTTTASARR